MRKKMYAISDNKQVLVSKVQKTFFKIGKDFFKTMISKCYKKPFPTDNLMKYKMKTIPIKIILEIL